MRQSEHSKVGLHARQSDGRETWLSWRLAAYGARFALFLSFVAGVANAEVARQVRPVLGKPSTESLVGITKEWKVVFRHELSRRTMHINELVTWGALRDRDAGTHVVLSCGSILVGDVTAIDDEAVTFAGRLWPETKLPRGRVRGIVLRPPLDLLQRDLLFDKVRERGRPDDQLLLDNGDRLSGQLAASVQAPGGAVQIESFPWRVPRATQTSPIPASRVVALLFQSGPEEPRAIDESKSAAPRAEQRVMVGFSDSSHLVVEQIERDGDALRMKLIDGAELKCERALPAPDGPWQDVVLLQPLPSNAMYLSDLDPLGHKHVPLFELDWSFSRNANVEGGRLRHAGAVYTKGIGMHSTARLAFELTEPYKWFDAELAIDQRAGREGSVIYRVYVQREGDAWSKAYESTVVRGAQPVVEMHVDIRGAVRLALIVDSADRLDVWDHANWLNARLVR